MKLLWQEDAVQRGICLGREGTWSKSGKPKAKQHTSPPYFITTNKEPIFLHTDYRHFRSHSDGDQDSDQDEEDGEDEKQHVYPRPSPAISHFGALPTTEAYLLDYFISGICPNCSLSSTHNPYLRYIAPMTFVYPPLHNAVISIAATERKLLNDRRFEEQSLWYKSQALKGLQATIASGSIGWPFIAAVLMLCFGDIADGCNDSWRTHLRGGLNLINQISADCTESQMLRKFCLMYFVAHDIMGHTASNTSLESTSYTWLEDDSMEEIDPLMGCSRGLLDIIDQISAVSSNVGRICSSQALSIEELEQVEQSRSHFERALHTLRQHVPSTVSNPNLALVAEAKRTTALLYLYDRFSTFSSSHSDSSETAYSHLHPLKQSLVSQLESLPVTPILLWPLFVLGNVSPDNEQHRRFVLERLDIMIKTRNLGSVRLARRLVERKFRTWDLQLDESGVKDGLNRNRRKFVSSSSGKSLRGKCISLA
ncbi:Nn.00g072940.m01.CDS01 [Neocucurbitaria sp. VM-36]